MENGRPNRSTGGEEAEAAARDYFHAVAPKLEKVTQKLVYSASKPIEELRETEYCGDLNGIDNQHHKKLVNAIPWGVKEDEALMLSYIFVCEDVVRRTKKKATAIWRRVAAMFEVAQVENPREIHKRGLDSLKGRYRRINENVNKWISAYKEAYKKNSGMSSTEIETEAHAIYEASSSGKFTDMHVFKSVMINHLHWDLNVSRDSTRPRSEDEESNEESRGSSKRPRTNEDGVHSTPSSQKIPISDSSTIARPEDRDAAKKKGKGKASQSFSIPDEFTAELRAMRLTRNKELELMTQLRNDKIELERIKEVRKAKEMNAMLLNTLLKKEHLSPEDEEMKRRLMTIVFESLR